MTSDVLIEQETDIFYPSGDGQPMAENMWQWEWIVLLKSNIERILQERQPVLVGSDNFVYPVRGFPKIVVAPDVYVAFGRPNHLRMSYKVWEEDGIFPQVVMEVLSPGNSMKEMVVKREFYEKYGAEEFYMVDPEDNTVRIMTRMAGRLEPVADPYAFVSPRLGIRFLFDEESKLIVMGPDGQAFYAYDEANKRTQQERQRAEREASRAEREAKRAEKEASRANDATAAKEKLAAKLRELGIDPDTV